MFKKLLVLLFVCSSAVAMESWELIREVCDQERMDYLFSESDDLSLFRGEGEVAEKLEFDDQKLRDYALEEAKKSLEEAKASFQEKWFQGNPSFRQLWLDFYRLTIKKECESYNERGLNREEFIRHRGDVALACAGCRAIHERVAYFDRLSWQLK